MGEGGEWSFKLRLVHGLSETDHRFLQLAFQLAERARGHTHPNPLVGAVVVREGRVVGEGYHPRAGAPHAEIFALRQAGRLAEGATVYVTLEPCDHSGRTPPCSLALLQARVARVVVAGRDPNPKARGGLERLRAAGIEVVVAGLADELRAQNRAFFTAVEKGRPFVRFKAGATLDGRVADPKGKSQWITGPSSRRVAHAFRQEAAAVVVGVGTVLADDPRLTVRDPDFRPFPWMREPPALKDPVPVVFDASARTPPTARLLERGRAVIFVGEGADRSRIEALRAAGAEVVTLPRTQDGLEVSQGLRWLFDAGLTSVLLEGGPRLAGAFFRRRLVDRVSLFLAPRLLGEGRGVIEGFAPGLGGSVGLSIERQEVLGDDLWIEALPVWKEVG